MNPIVRNSGLSASLLALSAIAFATSDSVRKTRELNDAWQFHLCKHADCTIDQLRATDWQPVEIPHTWNAQDGQDGGNNYFRGVGWYQRTLQIDRTSNHVRHFLRFRAASIVADVYIDGVHIGQHRGAFAAFCFEITDAISDGKSHQLMVRVDNRLHEDVMPLSGDFTMFGGIYRGVELISTSEVCISPLRFASSGVYLTQIHATPKEAKFGVNVYVQNEKQATKNVSIRALLLDAAENEVTIDEFKKRNESEGVEHYSSTLTIKQPRRWDGKADPYRFTLRVELIRRNAGENQPEILDVVEQTFGARE
ncbi:MAG: sugar-binding domain-containing protein, partial [Phycisphaerae bacterium]